MYKPINGFTKEKIIQALKTGNNDTRSTRLNAEYCAYRGLNGNKCAVGCFIPDEDYKDSMEGIGSVMYLLDHFPQLLNKMPLITQALVELQQVHDFCNNIGSVRERMVNWVETHVQD